MSEFWQFNQLQAFPGFSDAVAAIVIAKTKSPLVNYLDDFLFAAMLKAWCDQQVEIFICVCRDIKFPVALEKTFWGTTILSFLDFC